MKKRYLFPLLLPSVLLSSCIGPNWQVEFKRAVTVANGILEVQGREDFKGPENFRFYTQSFALVRSNNNGTKSTVSSNNTYTFDVDVTSFYFRYEYTQTSHDESDPARLDMTSVIWFYLDKDTKTIYDVSNLGTPDTRTYKKTVLEELEDFTSEMFEEKINSVLGSKIDFDYFGVDYIDPEAQQTQCDIYNAIEGVTCDVKFFSRYEHTLSHETNIEYDNAIDEDGYSVSGYSREIYGWENYFYSEHKFTRDITKVKDNSNTQYVDELEYKLTTFNSKSKEEYDYPDLTKFKLIEPEVE